MRLQLSGPLDVGSVPALWRRHRDIGALESIDLAQVKRVDSAGVGFVRVLQARSLAAGSEARLENLPGHFTELLEAHRLQPVGERDD
ncbi:STAS domain-containing protein [Pseudomarimonas salicorniae]|uniref:STAS domain-containing protein n=1 Tax=Pseudomarimonas salicorniae TaxID=2933270 RepID=A0ABT0GDT3_9GAMM|nr:STAS domain-containing protein [Lysobacter sp. CAU 1642]MCK7592319.1 STAS domain-containing protein [Lysobacter sp. CAU 1642]